MRRAALILLALAGCGKSGDAGKAPGPAAARKARVVAAVAAERDVESVVEATGTIEAAEEINVPARVSGVIDALNFKEGDAVTPETTLAEIDVEKYRLAEVRAQAECDRAKAQADLAETVYRNREALYAEGKKQQKEWVTEEQMATWRADVQKAKAGLAQAQADLDLARRDHANARVRPPIAGVINLKKVSRGEYVKPETVVATILNVATLYVRFTVPELEASRLSIGREVRFTTRSAPDTTFKATLFYMNQKADETTRAVECKAEIAGKGEGLRSGTYASVRIITGRRKSVVVPERAVLPTERGFVVFALDGAKAVARPVKVGLRADGGVEILEGLRAGETIVAEGAAGIRPGAEVDVADPAKTP